MKEGIHPKYEEITATCSCGNVIKTRSTIGHDLQLDVCSQCHPFYTGKQKVMDTGGRIDRFQKRFGGRIASKKRLIASGSSEKAPSGAFFMPGKSHCFLTFGVLIRELPY